MQEDLNENDFPLEEETEIEPLGTEATLILVKVKMHSYFFTACLVILVSLFLITFYMILGDFMHNNTGAIPGSIKNQVLAVIVVAIIFLLYYRYCTNILAKEYRQTLVSKEDTETIIVSEESLGWIPTFALLIPEFKIG